jgi:predicted AlkP superfamily phosphohydrolase/phosphomutase
MPHRRAGALSAGLGLLLAAALVATSIQTRPAKASGPEPGAEGRSVIVIGIDGMDWALTERMMAAGELPSFARLAAEGSGGPLGTSVPPLSPVAWSDFLTGTDAGGHGIFDFIHRHPSTMGPYLSTSEPHRTGLATKLSFLPETIPIGKYCLPLAGEEQVLLRHGTPFWEPLEAAGIETTIVRMPANFPVTGTATRELSGMGTPDLLGTYGTFTFYTTDVFAERKSIGGGQVVPMDLWDDVARGKLYGPPDGMLCEAPEMEIDFRVYIDPEEPVAVIQVGDEEAVLAVGEWSPWVPIRFEMTGPGSLGGIVRFYLRQLEPEVELYASPINIDPHDPAQPISTPASYAAELAEATGIFYTQGMPEDTRALSEGYLTRDEFLDQARLAAEENIAQFHYVLDRFEGGLLFYYFGNLDQVSHMMWGTMDPTHPGYDAEQDSPYADVVPGLYRQADEIVGYAMERLGENTTLIVMSDHGFASWKRAFHLNAWLAEHGYLVARNPGSTKDPGALLNVDWSRTRAYGLGFNGLYVNLRGREKNGVVDESEKRALLEEIGAELLATVDPASCEVEASATETFEEGGRAIELEEGAEAARDEGRCRPAVTKIYLSDDYFSNRGQRQVGPDLLVGYAEETRGHSNSAIGQVTGDPVFSDNDEEWSGDHGMDHEAVPGVLFTNRPLARPAASLVELAASVLAEFGIEGFPAAAE